MMIAIKGRRLFDCTGADPIDDAVVLVEKDRIMDIGSASQIAIPKEVEIIDVGDATIIPGLIDAHEHLGLCTELGYDRDQMESPEVDIAFRMARNARIDLKSGTTTVRTCGDKNSLDLLCRKAIEEGFIPGPRIIASGAGITSSHGHGGAGEIIADGVDEIRKTVRKLIFSGVDLIKLFVTGGTGTLGNVPWLPYYTRDEIAACAEEAHNVGIPVTSHCHGGKGIDWCIDVGFDSIEHCAWGTEAQFERMAEKGIWLVPTLHVLLRDRSPSDKPRPQEAEAKRMESRKHVRKHFQKILDLGVKVAAGVDTLHGEVWRELEWMVSLGMKPKAALLTATKNAAELCKRQDSIGTLEKGKLADIIAVKGDPLTDISCLQHVSLVMKGGKRYQLLD